MGVTDGTTIFGGGYQNCGCVAPAGIGHSWLLLSGGDIAGVHASTDGVTWKSASKGLAFGTHRVGALAGSQTVANRVWGMMARTNDGAGPNSGQLLRGAYNPTSGVVAWTLLASVDPGAEAGGAPRPRHAGRLLALDEANDAVYMATVDGIWKFSNLGGTVATTQRALAGSIVTGIVLDPDDPTVMYAAVRSGGSGAGVYRLTNIRSGTVVSTLKTFTRVEDLVTVNVGAARYLYAACMTQGPQRWLISGDVTAGWVSLSTGYNLGSNGCAKVDAHLTGTTVSQVRLLCGNAGDVNSTSGGSSSDNGGTTWKNEATDWNVSSIPWGETEVWWLAALTTRSQLNDNTWDANTALIDHANPDRLFLIGRAGVWRSIDGGLSWRPLVRGLNATVAHRVAAQPGGGSKAATADTDWTTHISAATGLELGQSRPNAEQPTSDAGRGVMFHRNGTLAIANEAGEVWTTTNPFVTSPTWVSNGFAALAGTSCQGVAIGQNAAATQVLLTMRVGSGIQRKLGSAAPTVVSTLDTAAGNHRPKFCWPSPGGTYGAAVYCAAATGLLRSLDYGATWTRVLSYSTSSETAGAVDCDPTDPTVLYLTADDGTVGGTGLFRIDNANATATRTKIGPTMNEPGPCAVDPVSGVVYVCTSGLDTAGTKLYVSPAANPTAATTFTDATDDGWAGGPFHPYDMTVTANQEVLAANNQGGYFLYRAGAGGGPPDPIVLPAGTYSQWSIAGTHRRMEWKQRIDLAPATEGFFWAMQASFEASGGNPFYAGLQANADLFGSPIRIAIFSVWNALSAVAGTAAQALATPFTDEGEGWSVRAPYAWVDGATYTLRVQADDPRGSDWWRFDVVADATGVLSYIGSIQTPAAFGDIAGTYALAFTEWFTNEGGLTVCSSIPQVTAFFGTPGYSSTLGPTGGLSGSGPGVAQPLLLSLHRPVMDAGGADPDLYHDRYDRY